MLFKTRYLVALTASTILVAGCVTTPSAPNDIGVGRYGQTYTISGNLMLQGTFRSPIECEAVVRNAWSGLAKDNLVAKCSDIDLSKKLPYGISDVKTSKKIEATEFRYFSRWYCESSAASLKSGPGNYSFNDHCSTPFPDANPAASSKAPQ